MNHRPPRADAAELDALIAAAELRLLERQARVRRETTALGAQARAALTPERLAVPAVAALLLWGLWRAVRPRARAHPQHPPPPRMGAIFWITQFAAIAWPFVTPAWRARLSPAGIASLLGAAWQRERGRAGPRRAPPRAVAEVDLERFAGTWYEVARIRNRFEDACTGQPSVTYLWRDDRLDVVERCPEHGGGERVAHGVARAARGSRGARLELSFAPRWLHALPFAWGECWILHLESDYGAALVGTPDRKRLWLLARERALPQATMLRLLDAADAQGFDLQRLVLSHPAQRTAPRAQPPAARPDGAETAPPLGLH